MEDLFDCVKSMDPMAATPTMMFWESKFNCSLKPVFEEAMPEFNSYPKCPSSISERRKLGKPCQCTGDEKLDWRPEAKLSYVHDATMLLLRTISKILNACKSLKPSSLVKEICNDKESFIKPGHILKALKQDALAGLTGNIAFEGTDRKG